MTDDRLVNIRGRDALGLPDGATLSGIEWWARQAQDDRAALVAEVDRLRLDLESARLAIACLLEDPTPQVRERAERLLGELPVMGEERR